MSKAKSNHQWKMNFYFRQVELGKKELTSLYASGLEPEFKEKEVQRYTLKEYIEFLGTEAAAELFDSKPDTVKSWRYGMRQPSIQQAKVIMQVTGGKLDFESIYGPIDAEEKQS
ncbi:hypothetical protein N9P69_00905 [Gammaproteobacteria bacterium]|jgi:hypothetical protein|nr:hypothetical protein [Gammaproteobacteria bacterium]|tara:strand:+ start:1264 stop:1605 length:342 start_codon:yes stop_codon:yes gene_type:complete